MNGRPVQAPDAEAAAATGRAVVSLDAIRHNLGVLQAKAGGAGVMAVVKANAYGHGLAAVARAAAGAGAAYLGAAQLGEALALVAALDGDGASGGPGERPPVMAWIYGPDAPFDQAVVAGIELGVNSRAALAAITAAAKRTGVTARVHLKLDTGLGRAGAPAAAWEDLVKAMLAAQAEGAVAGVGMWSHFAYADAPAHPTVAAQEQAFRAGLAAAERLGARFQVRHLANSAALLTGRDVAFDLVRPGLALYGLSPIPDAAGPAELGLVPAMTLQAPLTLVKRLPAGHGVSYGHVYTTPRDTVTGVVPLGYADGVFRHASDRGPVQVGGRRLKVAGRVCMDQFVVDLGPDATEREGATVTLFGPGTDGEPTAQDWADAAGTISYEIVTRVGAHLPRVHTGGAK